MLIKISLFAGLAFVALVGVIYWVGSREPIYTATPVSDQDFLAIRFKDRTKPFDLGEGAHWQAQAAFPLIGADDAYWHGFALIAAGHGTTLLENLGSQVEDAYLARIKSSAPPKLALGFLRVLYLTGMSRAPSEEVEAAEVSNRSPFLPGEKAVQQLLAQPETFHPAMVNFLAYKQEADYSPSDPARSPSTGREAYARYGRVALQTVYRTGGHLLFYARIDDVLRAADSATAGGKWDEIAAMLYTSPPAILSMDQVPTYRAALGHREAGLSRTIVIASEEVR
jgi:hypothetical protein